jgi:hypothetical protein
MTNKIIIFMLQLAIIFNAMNLGWKVKLMDSNQLVLSKKIEELTELDNDTEGFLSKIIEMTY